MTLRNQNILIFGGGSGIGKAIAIRMIELGAKVLITGRTEEKLQDICKEIHSPNLFYKVFDITNIQGHEALFEEVKETLAGLNAFVNAAAMGTNQYTGRDVELLKRISEKSEIHIVCSTGFYYTDEPVLYNTSPEQLCRYLITDARNVNAGIIKCAVEQKVISSFQTKLLRACAMAHLHLGLPIVLHTNAKNENAAPALEILLSEGVKPNAVTVGHLSDSDNVEYVKSIASYGCYIGLDRLYKNTSEEYISKKIQTILQLCKAGYETQILLSHDALFFNGFEAQPHIHEQPRYTYCFEHILPHLPKPLSETIMVHNPIGMLSCK